MKKSILLLAAMLCAGSLFAGGIVVAPNIQFPGAPTGACFSSFFAENAATGDQYNCLLGAWNQIATGGVVPVSGSGTANIIPKFTAATVIANSSVHDDGTQVYTAENVGIGTTTPTAVLQLKAGTTAASSAPLKFTSGSLLTSPEAGAVEFLTDAYYGTITTGPARKTFAFTENLSAAPPPGVVAADNASPPVLTAGFTKNAQTSTYQVLLADFYGCKTITVASGTFTITLVASGTQPPNGNCIDIVNYGSGVVTVARSGQNINGGTASITLNAGTAAAPTSTHIISDGTNYFASINESATGSVTSVATTSPIAGGTITSTGTITCATCATSASAETSTAFTTGAGGQAIQTPSATSTLSAGGNASFAGTVGGTSFTSTGTTAGFADYPQGTTSVAVAPCNVATSICEQAPAAVTSYLVNKPGVSATGMITNNVSAAVITQGFSGDAGHSAVVTIGSGASIGSTSLCSTALCPVGTYRVNVYVDLTTPCGTTGTYIVNLIYTDDVGSKTVVVNINGTGAVPATGVLTTTSTNNFGENAQIIRSTGGASINYSTTATACGTAGPMVGKLYLSVEPLQ